MISLFFKRTAITSSQVTLKIPSTPVNPKADSIV
uniref:Uncharacterized protein n=1 Tax=Arundo donax TaxID=35708 RepID=A0A0A9GW07_ARUDO